MTRTAYIGFGANLGDRLATFNRTLTALGGLASTTVAGYSRIFSSEPVGLSDDGSEFLNAVIAVVTALPPGDLFREMHKIELSLGKSPNHRSDQSRAIDLDLLLYDGEMVETESLCLPHPRMHERAFVMVPLAEIAPDALHPVFGLTAQELLARLSTEDIKSVRLFKPEIGQVR